jgi:hypothetical protein
MVFIIRILRATRRRLADRRPAARAAPSPLLAHASCVSFAHTFCVRKMADAAKVSVLRMCSSGSAPSGLLTRRFRARLCAARRRGRASLPSSPILALRPARLLARNAGRQDLQDQVRAVPHGEPRRGPQAGPQPVRAAAAAAPPRRRSASARERSHSRGLRAAAATPLLPPLLALRRHGLIGRTSGTTPGFAYSAANKAAGIVWSEEHLFDYLLGACGSEPSPRASARARARATIRPPLRLLCFVARRPRKVHQGDEDDLCGHQEGERAQGPDRVLGRVHQVN